MHPQKTEVKFADEEAVWQIVNAAVRETLAKTGAVPLMDFDRDSPVEIPVLQKGAVYSEPLAMSNSDYNPFREEYIDPSAPDPNVDFTGFDVPVPRRRGRVGQRGRRIAHGRSPERRAVVPAGRGGRIRPAGADAGEFEEFESGGGFEITPSGGGFDDSALDFIPSSAVPEQQRFDMPQRPEFTDALPLPGGYVAALLGGRFVVVDVRRAASGFFTRITSGCWATGSSVSQQLLFPERLVLSGDEYALLEENAVEFAALGFDIDFCGEGTVEVRGTPADMPADAVDRLLFDLLQAFATPVSLSDVRREKIAGRDGPLRRQGCGADHVARGGRGAARTAGRHGQFQFFALGQGDHRRDHAGRFARQVGIIRRKKSYICKN